MEKLILQRTILVFSLLSCCISTSHYEDLQERLSINLRAALTNLGRTAKAPHPELGMKEPLDPLYAAAPLRYTNEDELLKLRLLLTNVTLVGLSSLLVQEISFSVIHFNRRHGGKHIQDKFNSNDDDLYDYYLDQAFDGTHLGHESPIYETLLINEDAYAPVQNDAEFGAPQSNFGAPKEIVHTVNSKKMTEKVLQTLPGNPKTTSRKKRSPGPKKIPGFPSKESSILESKIRISFTKLRVEAQYVIRGSAGGVFNFKEHGRLNLVAPNVFLTSTFNISVISDSNLFRHENGKRIHIKVQKIRSRMSIKRPQLELMPATRPPEWVRRQVQQKMKDLGEGVGKRDGAIRLLLRKWGRLIRKVFGKVAKDLSAGDEQNEEDYFDHFQNLTFI